MSGELLSVRLRKPWGDHKAGEAVLVDRLRAWKLEDLRVGSIEPPDTTREETDQEKEARILYGDPAAEPPRGILHAKAPTRAPRDKMVRTSKKKGKK